MGAGGGDVRVAVAGGTAVGVAAAAVAVGAGGGADGVAVAGGTGAGEAVVSSPQASVNSVRTNKTPKGMNSIQFLEHFNFIVTPSTLDLKQAPSRCFVKLLCIVGGSDIDVKY